MAVLELKATISIDAVGTLEDLLAELEEQRLMILEEKPGARAWLAGYFQSVEEAEAAWNRIRSLLPAGLALGKHTIRELAETDWKDSYRAHFKAWKFGPLNWVPVWERNTFILPAAEEVLWLDPGMAFGTGNHETTRLVVERLIEYRNTRGVKGRVIDAGCGSGILALSAVKLGFGDVTGFDNDAEAVRVSGENAVLNGLAGKAVFFTGDLAAGLAGRQAELVLANIQADVLMRFARELSAAVAPGGELVLSGILAGESAEVAMVFGRVAPHWRTDSRVMGEWSDLVLRQD